MKNKDLGLGLITDRVGRHGRVIRLSIEKLGIIKGIEVRNGEVIYPVGVKVSNKLRNRISLYLGL